MKTKFISLAIVVVTLQSISAQPCLPPSAIYPLHGNNTQVYVHNGGTFFYGDNGGYLPNFQSSSQANPTSIFAASLWLSGTDINQNKRVAGSNYPASTSSFFPGPLSNSLTTTNEVCGNWNRIFAVKGEDILAHIQDFADGSIQTQIPSIYGWPAFGNPYFFDFFGFHLPFSDAGHAPFNDVNEDGLYNPDHGDHPILYIEPSLSPIIPAEMAWYIMNTGSGNGADINTGTLPLNIEIKVTVYALQCDNDTLLNNTIFTKHSLFNRNQGQIENFRMGLWVDFDLGCYLDDNIGSLPEGNTFFAYNSDAMDGYPNTSCAGGLPTFNGIPPIQSVTFLNHTLDKFLSTTTVPTSPTLPAFQNLGQQIPAMMAGYCAPSTPLTVGGSGCNPLTPNSVVANHLFPGDPANTENWTMCSDSIQAFDIKGIGSTYIGNYLPAQIIHFNTMWSTHYGVQQPCNIGNMASEIEQLKTMYLNKFPKNNCIETSTNQPFAPHLAVKLSPNPASNSVTIACTNHSIQDICVLDLNGRRLLHQSDVNSNNYQLATHELTAGLYFLEINTSNGKMTQKLVILK